MKKLLTVALIALSLICLSGCGNYQIMDTNYTFNKANIKLQTGEVITVEVSTWNDYEGEQIQIVSKDGTVYLVNSVNCELINE